MWKIDKYLLLAFSLGTALSLICGVYTLFIGPHDTTKWLATSGLLATISGLLQLEVSGLFKKLMDLYANEAEYPYGPPSHFNRKIIDDVDHPISTWVRDVYFYNPRTGFWLIIAGTLVQVVAVWV